MADMSLPLATLLYSIGNGVLIVGAIAVVLGTWLAVYTGGIKERYADDRIAANEAQTASAKAAAAQANESAARIGLQTEELRQENLKLQQSLVWRSLTPDQTARLQKALQSIRNEIPVVETYRVYGDSETNAFFNQLTGALMMSGISTNFKGNAIKINVPGVTLVSPASGGTKLYDAFLAAGIDCQYAPPGAFGVTGATMIVGEKRQPQH